VAPQVLPGQYVATLKVGEKSFSQPITMVHDAQSSFSIQDRELQFRTAMELFGIHEALARLVSDIMARQKSFTDSLPKLTRTKDKRKLQAAIDSLEVLRETLVPTKQTSLFADVERLRERITEVYVAVCNNEQAPNNLQLARVRELRRQLDEAKARFDGL
jgi:polyhydroxyalkanoate synthesis regulator phasin